MKHSGGGIMVLGCMNAASVGNLCFIEGNMNWQMYLNILKQNILSSAKKSLLELNLLFN